MDPLAGADLVIEASPALVVQVLTYGQDVQVTREARPLVDHPGRALHAGRVAATPVGVEVSAVALTLIPAALVVLVLVEDELGGDER